MESNLCFKENLIHCSTAGCKRLSTSTFTLKQGLLKLLRLYKIRYEVYLFTFSFAFFFLLESVKPCGIFSSLCLLHVFHSNHLKSTSGKCVTSRATPEMTARLSRRCVASISIGLKESRHVTLQDLGGNLRIERAPAGTWLPSAGSWAVIDAAGGGGMSSKFQTGRASKSLGYVKSEV